VKDSTAIAVLSYRGSGRGTTAGISFDEAEQRQIAEVRRDRSRSASGQAGTMSLTASTSLPGGVALDMRTTGDAPLRVGGRVRTPVKIVDVPPIVPDVAIRVGIKGIVIVEITIDTDGSVKDARVLRSIPLLDQAALDAVRQWRYEPPTVDGQPVTVVMTVTVPFS
jgi:TonB family protein